MSTKSQSIYSIAQEIQIVRALASNNRTYRERALKMLGKMLHQMSSKLTAGSFNEVSFMRMWKGLMFCIWMADKPLIQEETVDNICNLVHKINNNEQVFTFVRCFYEAVAQVWMGLDQHRLDKFLMLVRRFIRQVFVFLSNLNWSENEVQSFSKDFFIFLKHSDRGLRFHICDIYLEELAKIGDEKIPAEIVTIFIDPWCQFLSTLNDKSMIAYIKDNIFFHLMKQSEIGIAHEAKFECWKRAGFPGGDISVMEEVPIENLEDDNDGIEDGSDAEENRETSLDARAGRVDVCLPLIHFDTNSIISCLQNYANDKETTTGARKALKLLIMSFSEFSSGKYPIGIHKVVKPDRNEWDYLVEDAVEDLMDFNKETSTFIPRGKKLKQLQNGQECQSSKRRNHMSSEVIYSNGNIWEVSVVGD